MKNHHEYEKIPLGSSDIASLTIRTCKPSGAAHVIELPFGEDGGYAAYLVDEDAEIGTHYSLVCQGHFWMWFFDDEKRVAAIDGEVIRVFRAGMRGCIIQVLKGESHD